VEVLLKDDPHQVNGLLYINSPSPRPISLAALVGAVAPNLDVAIEILTQEDTQPVVRPGDWLRISDFELVSRLNPTLNRSAAETPKADRALMQPIEGAANQVFGRAFISPSRYSFLPADGWVTISGLRAARIHNVEGVLLGEAVTAARDAAQPVATKDALAQWASKQAQMIVASVKDEERQARSAEVVLECGGSIGDLKFVKWGSDWLSTGEFQKRLRGSKEIAISFRGDFDYDEDQDDVHPKEFRDGFKVSQDVALTLTHDGSILRVNNNNWPRSLTGQSKPNNSNVAEYARELIRREWGDHLQEDEEDRVVGKVNYSAITRRLTVFRPPDTEGEL
jgi:hypothetical protein